MVTNMIIVPEPRNLTARGNNSSPWAILLIRGAKSPGGTKSPHIDHNIWLKSIKHIKSPHPVILHPVPRDRNLHWLQWGFRPSATTAVTKDNMIASNWWNLMIYPGPWFNIKMSSYQYRKSHCGDKTVVRSSYLHKGISYTGKMASLCWDGPHDPIYEWCNSSSPSAAYIRQWIRSTMVQIMAWHRKIPSAKWQPFCPGGRWLNTLRPRQNGRCFEDDTFKRIFLNENIIISIKISLKLVPMVRINNIPALVQIMAWRQPGDKPLSGPTRTTRMPAFWGYPPAASWLPIPLSHIGSQVKRWQSQSYKF